MCVQKSCVVGVYICTLYVYSPLFTSGAGETTDNGENNAILSQKVYGELVILMSLVRSRA